MTETAFDSPGVGRVGEPRTGKVRRQWYAGVTVGRDDCVLQPIELDERGFVRGERIEKITQGAFDKGGLIARFDLGAPGDFAEQCGQRTARGGWDERAHVVAWRGTTSAPTSADLASVGAAAETDDSNEG
ncbi:hypothetical protein MSPGM_43810 [Methylorubrum sp. GM97]|nr:hypothetical protein MSPGM_43810 [Methylorubrum sp. GM97]